MPCNLCARKLERGMGGGGGGANTRTRRWTRRERRRENEKFSRFSESFVVWFFFPRYHHERSEEGGKARTGWAYSRGLINMTGRDDRLDRGKSLAAPGSQRGQLFPAIPARIPRGSVRLWTEKLHNVSAFSRESPRAREAAHCEACTRLRLLLSFCYFFFFFFFGR